MNIIIAEMSTKHMSLQMAFTLLNQWVTLGNVCLCEFFYRWRIFFLTERQEEGGWGGGEDVRCPLIGCNPPASPWCAAPHPTSPYPPWAARNKFKPIIQRWHMETWTLQMPPGLHPAHLTAGVRCCLGMFGLSLPCSALLPANETMLKYLVKLNSFSVPGRRTKLFLLYKYQNGKCAVCRGNLRIPQVRDIFWICWRLIGLFNLMNMVNRFYGLGQPVSTPRQD